MAVTRRQLIAFAECRSRSVDEVIEVYKLLVDYANHCLGFPPRDGVAITADIAAMITGAAEAHQNVAAVLTEAARHVREDRLAQQLAAWAEGSADAPASIEPEQLEKWRPLRWLVAEANDEDLPVEKITAISHFLLRFEGLSEPLETVARNAIRCLIRNNAAVAAYFDERREIDQMVRDYKPSPEMRAALERTPKGLPTEEYLPILIRNLEEEEKRSGKRSY